VGIGAEAVGQLTPAGIAFYPQYRKWREWSAFARPDCASCVMLPLCLAVCPLTQMNDEDCCPPFKHNWERVLARSAGFPADQVKSVRVALAGCRVGQITRRDVGELALRMEQQTAATSLTGGSVDERMLRPMQDAPDASSSLSPQ
jgi:hypothetical protein